MPVPHPLDATWYTGAQLRLHRRTEHKMGQDAATRDVMADGRRVRMVLGHERARDLEKERIERQIRPVAALGITQTLLGRSVVDARHPSCHMISHVFVPKL